MASLVSGEPPDGVSDEGTLAWDLCRVCMHALLPHQTFDLVQICIRVRPVFDIVRLPCFGPHSAVLEELRYGTLRDSKVVVWELFSDAVHIGLEEQVLTHRAPVSQLTWSHQPVHTQSEIQALNFSPLADVTRPTLRTYVVP